jgi:tetratricopeptide (TPR) repeat protein
MHTIPAPYNLGLIETILLVEGNGNYSDLSTVVSRMGEESRARGFYQFVDARSVRMPLSVLKSSGNEREAERFRSDWKADVYAAVDVRDCRVRKASKVFKEKDKDDREYSVTKYWHEASCELKVDLVNARDGREIASFGVVSTQETSPSEKAGSYDESVARGNALDGVALEAIDRFTPRRTSQSIFLEKEAPLGKEGGQLVSDRKLPEARRLWEENLNTYRDSAPYNYNLGAVCDALGDNAAARRYYEKAIRLDPSKDRYSNALGSLEQREADARALRQKR